MKKIYLTLLAAASLLAASCSGFLEEYSQDEIRPKKVSDYSELINGEIYDKQNNVNHAAWLDAMTDDVDDLFSRPSFLGNSDVRAAAFGYYTWQANPEYTYTNTISADGTWAFFYHQILTVNMILDGIDEAEGTEADRQTVIGEALAIRAYAYFMLVNIYGEPYDPATASSAMGVPVNDLVGAENRNFHRASVADIYAIIVDDLKNAITALEAGGNTNKIWRWNAQSAKLLLARTYLFMQDWDNAAKMSTEVIEQTGGALWNLGEVTTSEYFFSRNNPEVLFTYGYGGSMFTSTGANGFFPPSTSLQGIYESGDYRYNRSNGVFIRRTGNFLTGYKFVQHKCYFDNETTGIQGYALRTAEAYLTRAEALSRTSNFLQAVDDLNTLRRSRFSASAYKDLTLTDQQEIIQFVRDERRREFCFEKFRWFDLRRWDRPSITHVYHTDYADQSAVLTFTLEQNDPAYTIPIPMAVVNTDTEIEQYTGRPERQAQETE